MGSSRLGSVGRRPSARPRHFLRLLRLGIALVAGCRAVACGACGCSLHADWAGQGLAAGPGLRLDARFDWLDQDRLWGGASAVAAASRRLPNDQEIQVRTLTRITTLSADWSPDGAWGLTLQLPLLLRSHETFAPGDTEASHSRSAGVGDLRLLGRFAGFQEDHSVGLVLGFKLPTGRTTDPFVAGPATGGPLDRGLQPGTGSTDLILAAYAFGEAGRDWSWFAQARGQAALATRDAYRPGNAYNLDLGLRRAGVISPQLQLNVRRDLQETGANADTPNSGATLVQLSPGFTAALGARTTVYAFLQVPLSQRVTGFQLVPRTTFSVGLSFLL